MGNQQPSPKLSIDNMDAVQRADGSGFTSFKYPLNIHRILMDTCEMWA